MQERPASTGTPDGVDATTSAGSRSENFALLPLGIAVLIAAALVGWLLLDDGKQAPAKIAAGPVLVSTAQLASAAHALDRPIYWAGPRDDTSYELTVTNSGRIYVRYLPRGTAAGDRRADFLTVGTYPGDHAYENLRKVSTGPAVHSNLLDDDGLLVAPKRLPKSVYLAYPNEQYQVEVYDSSAGAARRLALNGLITQIR
jgi:hypothetical protein